MRPESNAQIRLIGTAFKTIQCRYFRTGDLGRMEDGTYLRITGRIKEQYKLDNGKFVVPGPIEAAMTSSTYITQVRLPVLGIQTRPPHQ